MPIKFKCPSCGKALAVNESLAGKRAKCPTCQHALVIPNAAASAPAATPAPAAPAPAAKAAPARAPAAPRPAAPAAKPAAPPKAEDLEKLAADLLSDEPKTEAEKAPETIDFECPMCGEPVKMDIAFAGKQGPCPECRRIIKVPQLAAGRKADWRSGPAKPAGARQDDQPALEGAWGTGTDRGRVSGESLEAAGALPVKRTPMTVRQWIARGFVTTAVLVALVGGTLFALSWFGARKQNAVLAKAMDAVSGKQPALQGADAGPIHLAAARFHFQRDEKDSVDPEKGEAGSRQQLALARGKLAVKAGEKTNAERDALLIEVALAQVDMAGSGKAVEERRRISWKDVRTNLLQTLQAIRVPEGKAVPEARIEAVRLVTRKLIKLDQAGLAEELARSIGDGPVSPAVVGLELFRAGQDEQAKKLAALVLGFYPPEPAKPKEGEKPDPTKKPLPPPPPLTPEVMALAVVLESDKKLPKASEADQKDAEAIGKVMAQSVTGPGSTARNLASKLSTAALKLEGFVAAADYAKEDEDGKAAVEEAMRIYTGSLGTQRVPPWVLVRLVRLGIQHQLDAAVLIPVAKRIREVEQLGGWAELMLFRVQLDGEKGKADDTMLDLVERQYLSHGLARIDFARHNTLQDKGTLDAIEKWDEALRPFGFAGAALGLQGSKK